IQISLACELRMNAALKADFNRPAFCRLFRPACNLPESEIVRPPAEVLAHFTLRERAELAFEGTDISVVDVPRDHVADNIAIDLPPQLSGGPANRCEIIAPGAEQLCDLSLGQPIASPRTIERPAQTRPGDRRRSGIEPAKLARWQRSYAPRTPAVCP